ncbi:hypothetical protein D9M72_379840 [compost metagenome]
MTSMSCSAPLSARVSQRAMGGLSSGSSAVKAVHSSQLPWARTSRLPNSGYHSSAWWLARPMLASPSMASLRSSVRRVKTSCSREKPFFSSMPSSRRCSGTTPASKRWRGRSRPSMSSPARKSAISSQALNMNCWWVRISRASSGTPSIRRPKSPGRGFCARSLVRFFATCSSQSAVERRRV